MRISPRWALLEVVLLAMGGAAGWSAGCAANTGDNLLTGGGIIVGADGGVGGTLQCEACVTASTCTTGDVCAQFQGDSFCAQSCGNGGTACPSGTSCSVEADYAGNQVSVCVPDNNACSGGVSTGGTSGGSTGGTTGGSTGGTSGGSTGSGGGSSCTPTAGTNTCSGYADPTTTASCSSCTTSTSTKTCQPNGCYGGWYCNLTTTKCQAKPSTCTTTSGTTCPPTGGSGTGSTGGGTTGSGAGGGTTPTTPVSGTVTAAGGTVSSLLFAVSGDTRPANIDDNAGYPTAIIDQIYSGITARSPQPSFVVSTGDYQFSTDTTSNAATQMDLYLAARSKFPGPWFPAMGNHECTGATASNCGSGNTNGVTNNYTSFLSKLLGPINQTLPYYVIKVNGTNNAWTSKFVFIAANAWDGAQSSWLSTTLAEPTTYTFVMRHEANEANTAPGTTPSEAIVTKYPLTLEICGHTHTYSKSGNHIVVGNGGAPITGGVNYGYALVAQRSDGNVVVDMIDYMSGAADSNFHFVVTPTGSITQ